MSIKSTVHLKRSYALALYHELQRKLYGRAQALTNRELGDALDELREEECRREDQTCFDNYIVDDD